MRNASLSESGAMGTKIIYIGLESSENESLYENIYLM